MRSTSQVLNLFKNANYRKKTSKHVERNIYKCNEVFNFAQRKKKNKQTKSNTADQVVDMQDVIFMLMKRN